MPEARLQRCRENSKEVNCRHKIWRVIAETDIAPFHTKEGMRETIKVCFDCGKEERFIRSQEDYLKERPFNTRWYFY